MDSIATTAETKWYDPEVWPRWLRWPATIVLPLLVAAVVYVVYVAVNSLVPEVPSAITSLIAAMIASHMYVASGRIISPSSRRFVGYTLALMALAFIGYFVGMAISSNAASTPIWYSIAFGSAAAIGAVSAALGQISDGNVPAREVYAWMPPVLRWVLCLPIGIVFSFVVNFVLAIPLSLMHVSSDAVKLINTPLSMAVLIGVTVAVAPRGKNITGVALGLVFAIIAVVGLFATADRSLAAQVISNVTHRDPNALRWSTSVWYQSLSFGSVLIASMIGALGAVQAERDRRRAVAQ